jgi:regulator of RNase E activity RraA
VRVCRGDLVVGDADGVIVISEKNIAAVLDKAEAIELVEGQMKVFINAGNSLVASVEKYKQR